MARRVKRDIIVIDEEKCDGCGLCIPSCAEGALGIVDTPRGPRARLVRESACDGLGACLGECPRGALTVEKREAERHDGEDGAAPGPRQWPVQLHLLPPHAPFFRDSDFVLTADCVPFACGAFQRDFLEGKTVAVACPKLDDVGPYVEKLAGIIEEGGVRSMTVAVMEVPCCSGLLHLARKALARSRKKIPLSSVVIGIQGEVLERKEMSQV